MTNKIFIVKFDGETVSDIEASGTPPKVGDKRIVQLCEPPFTERTGVVTAVRQDGSGWKYDVKLGGE